MFANPSGTPDCHVYVSAKLQTSNDDAPSGKESRLKWDRHRRVSAALKPRHLLLTQFDRERERGDDKWALVEKRFLQPFPSTDGPVIVLILSLHPHGFQPEGQLQHLQLKDLNKIYLNLLLGQFYKLYITCKHL